MANLLDQASIVLTPTAYDNGKVLCAKPSEPPYGDFDFSRNSAATRVNAQGLVENVQILSSNLVQNGSFSEEGVQEVSNGSFSQEGVELVTNGSFDTDSDWNKGTGWAISGGLLNASSASSNCFQSSSFVLGKTYKLTYSISNYVSGSFRVTIGSTGFGQNRSSNGTFVEYIVYSGANFLYLRGSSSFTGSIDNVSVREVGQDWEFSGGAELTEQGARINNTITGANAFIKQVNSNLTIGKSIVFQYDVVETNGKNLAIEQIGGNIALNTSTIGNNKKVYFEFDRADASLIIKRAEAATDVTITNISVIEITDDTNLPRINYENFSYQDALGSELVTNGTFDDGATGWELVGAANVSNGVGNFVGSGGKILQRPNLTQGKFYRITFDILNYTSGTSKVYLGSTGDASFTATANGTYSVILEAESTTDVVQWRSDGGSTFIGSLDNCSVKEYLGQEVVPDSGCGHWLWEPQSTNLVTQSELFSGGFWGNYNSTITNNQTTAPDGLLTASKFSGTSDVTAHTLYLNAYPVVSGNDYTYSVFAKKNENNFIQINTGQGFGNLYANFDLDNGVVGNFNTLDADIEPYLNGWFKCSVKANSSTATGQSTFSLIQSLTDVRNPSFNALNNSVYIWGAQLEQQSYATSYIPTSGSTVTRNQDVCTNGGSLASINSTEGVLYAEISTLNGDSGSNRTISLSDSTNGNQIRFYFPINIEGQIKIRVDVGGSTIYIFDYNIATSETPIKLAFRYSPNGMDFYGNGSLVSSSALAPSFTNNLNSLQFRRGDGQFGEDFFGKTKALAVWKEALSDAELTELTTI